MDIWLRPAVPVAVLALLSLADCASEPVLPADTAYHCDDGRTVRLLVEEDVNRAVLTTPTESVTLLRGATEADERWVSRTGWEFREDDDEALLTSPGRQQTTCRQGRGA